MTWPHCPSVPVSHPLCQSNLPETWGPALLNLVATAPAKGQLKVDIPPSHCSTFQATNTADPFPCRSPFVYHLLAQRRGISRPPNLEPFRADQFTLTPTPPSFQRLNHSLGEATLAALRVHALCPSAHASWCF